MPGKFDLFADVGTITAVAKYPAKWGKREKALYRELKVDRNTLETFSINPVYSGFNAATKALLAAAPAAAMVIPFRTRLNSFEYYVASVNGTPVYAMPSIGTTGLDVPVVAANGVTALEITSGISPRSLSTFTVGSTPKFFLEAKVSVTDVAKLGRMCVGFRKAEAYAASPNSYTNVCAVHVGETGATVANGFFSLLKNLASGGASFQASGETAWANTASKTLRLEVDQAGNCQMFVDGVPSVSGVSFKFNAGEIVVPFFQVDTGSAATAGDPGVSITSLAYGQF